MEENRTKLRKMYLEAKKRLEPLNFQDMSSKKEEK